MSKLTEEAKKHIIKEVERVSYGKVTIVVNENMNDIDVVTEERVKFPKDLPRAGKVVTSVKHEG